MTDESHSCPAEEVLLDFVAERLDESTRQQVRDHLGVCGHCAESVEWMSRNLLKEATNELGGESQATEGLASEESVGAETEAWAGALSVKVGSAVGLESLSVSGMPNRVGRLFKLKMAGVVALCGWTLSPCAEPTRAEEVAWIQHGSDRPATVWHCLFANEEV